MAPIDGYTLPEARRLALASYCENVEAAMDQVSPSHRAGLDYLRRLKDLKRPLFPDLTKIFPKEQLSQFHNLTCMGSVLQCLMRYFDTGRVAMS